MCTTGSYFLLQSLALLIPGPCSYIGTQAAILYTSEPLKFGFFFACFFLPQLIACRYLQIALGALV